MRTFEKQEDLNKTIMKILNRSLASLFFIFAIFFPAAAQTTAERIAHLEAAAKAAQGSADNTWVLLCSALVFLMTVPGLALFYGGLVRQKNVLSTMLKSLISVSIVTLIWIFVGYSLVFSDGNSFLGGLQFAFLDGVAGEPNADYSATVPHQTFMVFQLMFAIITPALITGAFAERIKFPAKIAFTSLWTLFVYIPLAHMVWGKGGLLSLSGQIPSLDFAGGTVVHISSGVSALVCALYLGRRIDYRNEPTKPHNTVFTVIGAGLLWFGWFGFNAGSALSANALATNAFITTHFAAASGLLAWTAIDWFQRGKPSVIGAVSGAVSGLVVITPAAGFVSPISAVPIGLMGGAGCYFMVVEVKKFFGYDDTLDVFGIHGFGGTIGAVLTGIFAMASVNPVFGESGGSVLPVGLLEGNSSQLLNQFAAIGVAVGLASVGTFAILKVVDLLIGIRVTENDEITGLDTSQHGETAYDFGGFNEKTGSNEIEVEERGEIPGRLALGTE